MKTKQTKQKTIQAFYFAKDNKKLRYHDNRKIRVGSTHTVEGKLSLCSNGLHASKRLIDALSYAPGSQLYLVELSGDILEGHDKLCASYRKYLARIDADKLFREFARKAALINIELIRPYCSNKDYVLIVNYLNTGEKSLQSAARSAAWSAAWSAADAAAWSAANAVAWSAADAAAWSAARSAARSGEAAARSAARSELNQLLTDIVKQHTGWNIK